VSPAVVALAIAGGAVGTLLRYLVSLALAGRSRLPWGVVIVNVVGSALSGIVLGATSDPTILLIVVAGFCGGLTTFSTLSVDTIQLVLEGRRRTAVVSVLLNLVVGLAAVLAGWGLGGLFA
jgi:CrcB protein